MATDEITLVRRYLSAQVETQIASTTTPLNYDVTSAFGSVPMTFGDITALVAVGNIVPFPPQDIRIGTCTVYCYSAAGYAAATSLDLELAYTNDSLLGQGFNLLYKGTAPLELTTAGPSTVVVRRAHFDLMDTICKKGGDLLTTNPLLVFGWLRTNGGTARVVGAQIQFTGHMPWPGSLRAEYM